MKKIILLHYVLFVATHVVLTAQVIDSSPTGYQNVLPVLGGGIQMKIDTVTPLNELIERFNDKWDFIETGKAYWIGYTNDMYSIAYHKEDAIPALIDYVHTTKNENGKIGAIYTLHLIGIESKIIGRNEEKFINVNARKALLYLLNDKDCARCAAHLLMRDPWKSDIPYLMEALEHQSDENAAWAIIRALVRYDIQDIPIRWKMPDNFKPIEIELDENYADDSVNFDSTILRFDSRIKKALKTFQNQYPDEIKVEEELYDKMIANPRLGYGNDKINDKITIDEFVKTLINCNEDGFEYWIVFPQGGKIQYFIQDDETIWFCSIHTAKAILNDWWRNR